MVLQAGQRALYWQTSQHPEPSLPYPPHTKYHTSAPECAGMRYRRPRHRTTRAVTATLLTLSSASRRQVSTLRGGGCGGMAEMSSKSMSLFQHSRMPARCPAPTTATTLDALQTQRTISL